MYRYNKDWNDIKEIPQDDSIPIVSIRYSEEYVEVFNYFRAICKSEEFSERALSLCSHALRLNPNNYNVWIFRRKILKNIDYDPQKELCWSEELIRENPKNFYAWEHRRAISNLNLSFSDAETELNLTEYLLVVDPKSYHAWQHRQWTIQTHKFSNFGLLTSEIRFTGSMLSLDMRNNSAWNQRFFVIKQRGKVDFILVKREFSYAVEMLKIAFDNESAWNYLRGILTTFKSVKKHQLYQDFISFTENEFYEKKNLNRHLVGFIIDAKIETILEFCESNEMIQTQKVFQLCNLMADRFDPLRKNYWKFVYKKFTFDKIKLRQQSEMGSESGGAKQNQTWKETIGKKITENGVDEHLTAPSGSSSKIKNKVKKQVGIKKKSENCEKAKGIGTDLLFEIMNKYNN